MIERPTAAIALAVALGVGCQLAADRWRFPSIILLLGAGLLAGPGLDLIDPDALLGELLFPAVSAAVALLLFEGGLSLRLREVGGLRVTLLRLLTVGVVASAVLGSLAAWALGGLAAGPAMLFGAITVVTGPTVVIPLLRHARLRPEVARLLRWEGIFVDPIGAILGLVVFEVLVVGPGGGAASAVGVIAATSSVGLAVGLAAGIGLTFGLQRGWVPDHLHNAVTFATVMGAMAAANAVFHEAGLVSTTVLGVTLAAQRKVSIRGIADFHESIAVVLVPLMFILLAARVSSSDLARNVVPAAAVTAVLVAVSRPLSVWLSTIGSSVSASGRRYMAAMAPRGIVAASVSALLGLRLEEEGIDGGADLAAMTFLVVAATVVIYGLAAVPLARRWRVDAPDRSGVVLVGAPAWAVSLGEALLDRGVPVLVVPCDEDDAAAVVARGMLVYSGRLQSDELDDAVAAVGARMALVASSREEVAAFAADRLGHLLGQTNIYVVPIDGDDCRTRSLAPAEHWGVVAFGGRLTLEDAAARARNGATIVTWTPGERRVAARSVCPLLVVNDDGIPSIVEEPHGGDVPPGSTFFGLTTASK